MKMRKLLAVVLAVTLAISAMAISVFADDLEVKIDMYNYSSTSTTTSTTTYTIDIPAYYLYGYLVAGNSLTLSLPTNLTSCKSVDAETYGDYYVYYNASTKAIVLFETKLSENESATENTDSNNQTYYTLNEVSYYGAGTDGYGNASETTVEELYADYYDGSKYYYPSYNIGVSYSLTVNGVNVDLLSTGDYNPDGGWKKYDNTTAYGTFTQDVIVGTFATSAYSGYRYNPASGGESYAAYAMIPNTGYLATDTITITATVDWSATGASSDVCLEDWRVLSTYNHTSSNLSTNYGYVVSAVVTETSSGSAVSSTIYGYSMTATKTSDSSTTSSQNNVIIIADTTTATTASTSVSAKNAVLYWNHNLQNRAYIMNAANTEGATAKLVVELADSIYGYAVYTLTASAEAIDGTLSDTWSNSGWYTTVDGLGLYNATVDTYVLSGETIDTLEFDVDTSLLYNSEYGVYNGSMWINELLTLDTGDNSILSSKYYTNSTTKALEAKAVYLVLTFPGDEDVVETEQPVEVGDTTTEEDGEDVDDVDVGDDASEPAETNPTTGIVLALVPMAVAAAAAVASKRR